MAVRELTGILSIMVLALLSHSSVWIMIVGMWIFLTEAGCVLIGDVQEIFDAESELVSIVFNSSSDAKSPELASKGFELWMKVCQFWGASFFSWGGASQYMFARAAHGGQSGERFGILRRCGSLPGERWMVGERMSV